MRAARVSLALLATLPIRAVAQEAPAQEAPAQETPAPQAPAVWVANVTGGMIDRADVPASPYATAALTRYKGATYLRGAFTAYRGAREQPGGPAPAHYYIGSLGAGGNFGNWVVDAYASYGRQDYGAIDAGPAQPTAARMAKGTPYFAAGLRAGRIFTLTPHLYATPTAGVQFITTRSLRPSFTADPFAQTAPGAVETREKAWTGIASLRLDRAFGPGQQTFAGLSYTHYASDNGLTALAFAPASGALVADATPDGWDELGASATIGLNARLSLEGQALRTFGAVSGDATTLSLGLSLRF